MNQIDRFLEIIATYRKHGWSLRRVLMKAETRASCAERENALFENAEVENSIIDALWFSRPSRKRQAWELRLVADTPYALFETFESDEPEERCEEVRREIKERMCEYVVRKPVQ